MRDLYLRIGIRFQNTVERVDRNEANVEHASNELMYEWPHLVEHLHPMVAAVMGSHS